jgi:hypothetical protein
MKNAGMLLIGILISSLKISAQEIIYSELDKDDNRSVQYEIVGKMNDHVIIYKGYRDIHYISVYDNEMKMTSKTRLDFLPDHIFNADFLQYPDYFWMFYEYQKKNILYCMAVKFDASGKKSGDPVQLDTTEINFAANNKIYNVINSEDKQKILVYKINNKNEKVHATVTLLFDKNLSLLHKTRMMIPSAERNDALSDFAVDNDGDIVLLRTSGAGGQTDNVNKMSMITKAAYADNFIINDIKMSNIYLDDIHVKIDNFNKHYLITSFYSKQRRGNIDGIFSYMWDERASREMYNNRTELSDELRAQARGESTVKMAFNDYFIKHLVMRKDGGYIIIAESEYTSTRGNVYNRWDYNGTPYSTLNGSYYYYNSPYSYPWSRYGMNNVTRYYADNITILSFDGNNKLEWSNVIGKSQYDDNTDIFIGYGMVNFGNAIHFIFNDQERRQTILNVQGIGPDGQIVRTPTIKNLDKGYDFMPKQLKQIGARTVIVPCQYRNYTCFAKIEFE